VPTMPAFPSIDLSKLDFSKLDLSKLDLSKLDLSKLEVAGIDTDKLLGVLRDAAYVVIGFGVLTVQQAQVRRRELTAKLADHEVTTQLGLGKEQVDDLVKALEARVGQLDTRLDQLEGKIDQAVEALGDRLPEQAGQLLGQAHEVAKAARKQVRGLLVNAA
jgi:hypothetical protein